MPTTPSRFSQLRWLQNTACTIAIIAALILAGLGAIGYGSSPNVWMVAAGGFVLFIALVLLTFTPMLAKIESTLARQLGELRNLSEAADKQSTLLESVAESVRISDAAKALSHRDQELHALRTAIREDLRTEKWELALNLIEEMERRFGFKDEADILREEVDTARESAIQIKLEEAIEMIDSHFQAHDWPRAESEIERLRHVLPDETKVLALMGRMTSLKEQHKRELRQAWDEAVRRSDTDHAIDILKELDQYLSSTEAKELQESARTVFKEKLLRLGVQFRFAVQEKRWNDSLSTGLELIREFPNSRMAAEVRDVLDTLRERVREGEQAEPTPLREVST